MSRLPDDNEQALIDEAKILSNSRLDNCDKFICRENWFNSRFIIRRSIRAFVHKSFGAPTIISVFIQISLSADDSDSMKNRRIVSISSIFVFRPLHSCDPVSFDSRGDVTMAHVQVTPPLRGTSWSIRARLSFYIIANYIARFSTVISHRNNIIFPRTYTIIVLSAGNKLHSSRLITFFSTNTNKTYKSICEEIV